jgi:nucleoside-diphosphate-sugar epimerase
MLAATHSAAKGCYLVTDAQTHSTRELYEMIRRALGHQVPSWHVPHFLLKMIAKTGDIIGRSRGRRFVFDSDALEKLTGSAWYSSERITRELGYRPTVTFEDALPSMVARYRGLPA